MPLAVVGSAACTQDLSPEFVTWNWTRSIPVHRTARRPF